MQVRAFETYIPLTHVSGAQKNHLIDSGVNMFVKEYKNQTSGS